MELQRRKEGNLRSYPRGEYSVRRHMRRNASLSSFEEFDLYWIGYDLPVFVPNESRIIDCSEIAEIRRSISPDVHEYPELYPTTYNSTHSTDEDIASMTKR